MLIKFPKVHEELGKVFLFYADSSILDFNPKFDVLLRVLDLIDGLLHGVFGHIAAFSFALYNILIEQALN
jgi:hypothetical protein